MKRAVLLLSLTLTACGPEIDCFTEAGTAVHGDSCDGLAAVQRKITAELVALGYSRETQSQVLLEVRTAGLDAYGAWVEPSVGAPVRGMTYCPLRNMTVARLPAEPWERTALAHEMFHIAQGCPFDRGIYDACRHEGGTDFDCTQLAQHPHWDVAIYPAIERIRAGADE